jgi:glycine cleavage system H lipoate-binding protein/TusA-related sulfurtransferase
MPLITTKIDNCKFPSGYLYDTQNFTWADLNFGNKKTEPHSESVTVSVGVMPVLSYIAGKIQKIKLKSEGEIINKGKSLGTIESLSYFGVIRSPLSGKIVEINKDLLYNPKLVNDSPFEYGWIAKIKPFDDENFESLQSIDQCKTEISSLLKKFNVKCFKNFPDFEMYELGTECSATLAKLDDFMNTKMKIGHIVHLVSDEPTADLEVPRWIEENRQELTEIIMEKNEIKKSNGPIYLFHILVKKLR